MVYPKYPKMTISGSLRKPQFGPWGFRSAWKRCHGLLCVLAIWGHPSPGDDLSPWCPWTHIWFIPIHIYIYIYITIIIPGVAGKGMMIMVWYYILKDIMIVLLEYWMGHIQLLYHITTQLGMGKDDTHSTRDFGVLSWDEPGSRDDDSRVYNIHKPWRNRVIMILLRQKSMIDNPYYILIHM